MDKIIEQLFSEMRSHVRVSDRAETSMRVMVQRGADKDWQFLELKGVAVVAKANVEKVQSAIHLLQSVES